MPTYTFRNKNTGEMTELFMSISAREKYLVDNPELEVAILEPVAFGDPVRMGIKKPDQGFRETLAKIHERVPGSKLNETKYL